MKSWKSFYGLLDLSGFHANLQRSYILQDGDNKSESKALCCPSVRPTRFMKSLYNFIPSTAVLKCGLMKHELILLTELASNNVQRNHFILRQEVRSLKQDDTVCRELTYQSNACVCVCVCSYQATCCEGPRDITC